jgi:hypothetical protein
VQILGKGQDEYRDRVGPRKIKGEIIVEDKESHRTDITIGSRKVIKTGTR